MATITEIKQKMLNKMNEMDLDRMTLADAGQYVMVLRTLSEIQDKPYHEALMDVIHNGFPKLTMPEPIRLGDVPGGGQDEQ